MLHVSADAPVEGSAAANGAAAVPAAAGPGPVHPTHGAAAGSGPGPARSDATTLSAAATTGQHGATVTGWTDGIHSARSH